MAVAWNQFINSGMLNGGLLGKSSPKLSKGLFGWEGRIAELIGLRLQARQFSDLTSGYLSQTVHSVGLLID